MADEHETPRSQPVEESASPAATASSPKAPSRPGVKKRLSAASSNATARARGTRRELKKLTEMDLEEKEDIPTVDIPTETRAGASSTTESSSTPPPMSISNFGVNSSKTIVTPSSLHEDFVNLMKAQGLEKMATEAGLMKDGALVDIKQEPIAENSLADKTVNGKRALSVIKPEITSPSYSSPASSKKRKYLKINKGLRHFSMKVCQKVEEKNVTSYNEVADELVREFVTMRPNDSGYDEKNIRRRVYDALNVLMAMDIISKERKEIRWRGLPTSLQHDAEMLLAERNERVKSVQQKKQHLQDLLVQQVAMKNLLKRNAKRRKEATPDSLRDEGRIFLPFIVANTNKDTVIQCEMSEDRQDIFFNFSNPFEINDDTEILRRLNLHKGSRDELKQIVSEKLMPYLPAECESKSEEA